MNVQYWSRNSTNPEYKKTTLSKIFSSSDLILIALVEDDETKKLISDDMLKSMKPSTIVSSIYAVYHLYNHELVLNKVKENKIFGYAFEGHPGKFNDFEGNIFACPSMAWCTKESLDRNQKIWVENIVKAANNNFEFRVN
jgi:phosphoglycerate dehydrogenase-like enzyme